MACPRVAVGLLLCAMLSACGGGGDGGSASNPPPVTTVSVPPFYPGDTEIPVTGPDVPGASAFDQGVKAVMKRFNIPGVGLAVTKDGQLIVARGYGYQDFEARQPMRADTMSRIGSVSKFVTALAIMRLRDQGQLNLDQTFLSILTDYQVAAGGDARLRDVTIRMLLQHAGGWEKELDQDPTNQPFVVARALGVPTPPTCRDIIRYTMAQPLQFAPGAKVAYSNTGYCILGQVVAKLSGQTYESYVRDQVLARADVHAMSIAMPHLSQRGPLEAKYYPFDGSRLVDSLFPGEGKVPITYAGDPITLEGGGGWLGSAVDLTRVMTAMEGTRVADFISPDSKTLMLADAHVPDAALVNDGSPQSRWRGLGLLVGPTADTYSHGGLMSTSQTAVHRFASGHTLAIVTNMRADQHPILYGELVRAATDAIATLPAGPATDLYPQYPSMSLPARNP
jgi:CubicO group peptidase (beta-lactamase class C family)